MFPRIVSGKSLGCCDTIEIMERSVGVRRFRMSTPPSEIVGLPPTDTGASYSDSSSDAMVDFPDPERPTIAVHEFAGMVMDTSRRTSASGREGYRKLTWVNFTGAVRVTSNWPICSWETPSGRFARRKSCVAVSRDVLI